MGFNPFKINYIRILYLLGANRMNQWKYRPLLWIFLLITPHKKIVWNWLIWRNKFRIQFERLLIRIVKYLLRLSMLLMNFGISFLIYWLVAPWLSIQGVKSRKSFVCCRDWWISHWWMAMILVRNWLIWRNKFGIQFGCLLNRIVKHLLFDFCLILLRLSVAGVKCCLLLRFDESH